MVFYVLIFDLSSTLLTNTLLGLSLSLALDTPHLFDL